MTNKIKLIHLSEIPDHEAKGFSEESKGRDAFFIVRKGEKIFSWKNACPHMGYQGSPMAWRKDAYLNKDKTLIVCSAHGAQFDIEDGKCIHGPCIGQFLTKQEIQIDVNGYLYWLPDNKLMEK